MKTTLRFALPWLNYRQSLLIGLFLILSAVAPPAITAQTVEWIAQWGPGPEDTERSYGVSADGLGNVYMTGTIQAPDDMFLNKYDATGTLLWTQTFGTDNYDYSSDVSADGLGNVYVTGHTYGGFPGSNSTGFDADAFLCKYDAAGTLQWTKQFGSSKGDISYSVSTDGLGNVYLSGFTGGDLIQTSAGGDDAFLYKYDAAGTLLWAKQFGTSSRDVGKAVSCDGLGNVYVSGHCGETGNVSLRKYDAEGTLLWDKQPEATNAYENNWDVSSDKLGNIYLLAFNRDTEITSLRKYDTSGTLLWDKTMGLSYIEFTWKLSTDGLGNVYVTTSTDGTSSAYSQEHDVFVRKYSDSGTLLWTTQVGSSELDWVQGISADKLGNVYFSGFTCGDFGGPHAGGFYDAFIGKITDVPEPSMLLLAILGFASLVVRRRNKK